MAYLHIGSCVEKIEPYAFNDCTVNNIKIDDSLKYVCLYAFNTNVNDRLILNLPNTVKVMGILSESTGYLDIGEIGIKAENNIKTTHYPVFYNPDSCVYVYDNLYNILNSDGTNKNIKLFDSLLYSDTNDDGNVNISDVVSLQKYLFGNGSVGYKAYLTKDGIIDIFYMVCMRKMILNK